MRALWWLGGGVAVLILVIATIWVVGWLLPVQHRASVSRTLRADPSAVWERIERVERWADWQATEVEVLAEDSVRVRQNGQTLRYRIRRPGNHTLVTEIDSPGLPFGGRWTWTVRAADGGSTVVTIVENGEVYDPLFRFFSRFVFGHESTIRGVLDRLEASFEQ